MTDFEHQRHKPPTQLTRPRELIVACAPLRTHVNLSRIARACGCFGVRRLIACGNAKVVGRIARDAVDPSRPDALQVEVHRTLPPVLAELRRQGLRTVGLEQATGSHNLYDYKFPRASVLVVGNERQGLTEEELSLVDDVVEIPVYGLPYAHNVATATAMALYEYCRQFPEG
ncbi:MAG: TrmH family RNA methyltransferase [Planctomycetes bacterium]|nr:TrmH family RNA methyltransferase [Planctomycetota bacterium]